jgi:hypothetical protein
MNKRYWFVVAPVLFSTFAGCAPLNNHDRALISAAKMIDDGKPFTTAKTLDGRDYFIVPCSSQPMCEEAASRLCQPKLPIKYLGLFESETNQPFLLPLPKNGALYNYAGVFCKRREELP